MMVVDVETSATLRVSKPRVLFEGLPSEFAVSPDGQRFLLTAPGENSQASVRIDVVVNWFEDLKRQAPSVN